MKKLLFIILLISYTQVYADIANGTFTPPTERIDTTPLLPEEIAGYNVYVDGTKHAVSPLAASATSFTLTVTATDKIVTVTTLDTDGRESVGSNDFIINAKANPNDPVINITIIISR